MRQRQVYPQNVYTNWQILFHKTEDAYLLICHMFYSLFSIFIYTSIRRRKASRQDASKILREFLLSPHQRHT